MSVITGLAGLQRKQQEHVEKEAARNRPKAEYFSWKDNSKAKNPDKILVQFLQELDPSASGYDENRGLAVAAVEHEAPGPKGYLRRALCTLDSEGQCYACERKKADYDQETAPGDRWKTKTNIYINALVDYNGKGDPSVVVISRNFNQSFAQQLMDIAVNEGTITDKVFEITKMGTGTQLIWILAPTTKPLFKGHEKEDVFDLKETVIRDVEYEKQPGYYGAVWDGATVEETTDSAASSPASNDEEW